MAYKLYFGKFEDIVDYEKSIFYKKVPYDERLYHGIFFNDNTKQKGKSDSLAIEAIDSVTSSCKNCEELIAKIKSHNISYLSKYERNLNSLCLITNKKSIFTNVPIIYWDKLIYIKSIEKRNKKSKNDNLLLELDDILESFIEHFITMAKDEKMKDFIFNPSNIKYIGIDRIELNNNIFKDYNYEKNGTVMSIKGLRSLLIDYINCEAELKRKIENNDNALEIERDFEKKKNGLYDFFRNYKNLRTLVAWENTYYKTLIKHVNDEEINDETRSDVIEQIMYLQDVKNERNDKPFNYDFSVIKDKYMYLINLGEKNQSNIISFNNPVLQQIYESEGLDAIMEQVDLDEILNNEEDAEMLGVIPKKRK